MPVAGTGMSTVTVQVAVRFVPSAVVAVMVAVPLATAVTTPESLTVATEVLLLVHVTLLSVALLGITVAVSVAVCPAEVKVRDVLFSDIPVAGTFAALTLMLNDTSFIVTRSELLVTKRMLVMVAVPPVKPSAAVSERFSRSPLAPLMGVSENEVDVRR